MNDKTVISTRVRDLMNKRPLTVSSEAHILVAAAMLTKTNTPVAPVIDKLGRLVGVLSTLDCTRAILRAVYDDHPGGEVAEYMRTDVATISADAELYNAALAFDVISFGRLPVVDNVGRLVGMVERRTVLGEFLKHIDEDRRASFKRRENSPTKAKARPRV